MQQQLSWKALFIAMKAKPITNNVNKWAERATCKLKLIIERIKTKRNNNKEAIERLDKQNIDRFRHKAHNKPQKKEKGKSSTVHSTFGQTSLSGFVSLRTTCTDHWGDSYIHF